MASDGDDTVATRPTESVLPQSERPSASIPPASLREEEIVAATGFRPLPGVRMGRYEIGARLGSGGMGVVFAAEDTKLRRPVAIKFLRPALTASRESLARFLREAQTASQLEHPNVVATYDIAEHEGLKYVVLELLDPASLRDFLSTHGPLHWIEASRIAAACLSALGAAHLVGLVHRDVKPDNILRSRKGVIKLTDFGLAKQAEVDLEVTRGAAVLGTPHYMSPEQCRARPVDGRSDLYSMGATYYALLVGRPPFADQQGTTDIAFAHCFGAVPDPGLAAPELPESVREIVRRSMAKNPDDRYHSAHEMLFAVETALAGAPAVFPESRFLKSGHTSGGTMPGRDSRTLAVENAGSTRAALGSATPAPALHPKPELSRRNLLAFMGGAAALSAVGYAARFKPSAAPASVAPASATAPPPALPPVRVGVLHSLSGTMAISEKSVVDATLLAIAELNDKGGVLGRPIEAVVADGRSDWPTFAREAERLISVEKVSVVFGGWTSASRKTMRPVFEQHEHLLFYPVQYEGLERSPNIVYTGAAPNQQILPAVKWCTGYLGAKRFFLVGSDYVFPRTANAIIRDAIAEQKAKVVGEEYLLLGQTDASAVVDRIKAAAPDVILNTINGDSNVAFFRTLRAAGISPKQIPTVSFSVGEDELHQITGISLAGDYLAWNYFASIDRPENAAFVELFRKKYGSYRVTTDPMEAGYFGVHLWALAVAKAGGEEPRAVRSAVLGMTYAAPGALVRVDAGNQHTWKAFRLGKVTDSGGVDIVFSTEAPIQPEPFPATRTKDAWEAFLSKLYEGWGRRWANPGK